MTISLQIFGQFRHATIWASKNLNELNKIFKNAEKVDIFILSDKGAGYSKETEEFLIGEFEKHRINIKLFEYWENLNEYYPKDAFFENKYHNFCKLNNATIGEKGYANFTGSLWYRKYVLNLLFNNIKNELYDWVFTVRLFDTEIKVLKELDFLENKKDDTLYFCIDTFFIGKESTINKLMQYGNIQNYIGHEVWEDDTFTKYFLSIDRCLGEYKPTFCSEVQICNYIYRNFSKFKNLRFDFNNPNSEESKDAHLYVQIRR